MLEVRIVTEQEELFSGQAHRVILPGMMGVFEVQSYHHPLVSLLLPGNIIVDNQALPIHRGAVKVTHKSVIALVDAV